MEAEFVPGCFTSNENLRVDGERLQRHCAIAGARGFTCIAADDKVERDALESKGSSDVIEGGKGEPHAIIWMTYEKRVEYGDLKKDSATY
jgi:uncharacterized protein YhfF